MLYDLSEQFELIVGPFLRWFGVGGNNFLKVIVDEESRFPLENGLQSIDIAIGVLWQIFLMFMGV